MHIAPAVPHCEADGVTQVLPLQHPFGHEPFAPEVQVQTPLTHACPVPHGALVPHAQSPVAVQWSDATGSHATHASPPKPHAVSERALQLGPEQQPVAHVIAHPEQAPFELQLSPPGHVAHALPPLPQAPVVVPGSQRLPTQQPDPQETRSQTHDPLRHRCPAVHAAPVPHWQAPAAEQLSAAPSLHAAH
jgi:hypothetical protein